MVHYQKYHYLTTLEATSLEQCSKALANSLTKPYTRGEANAAARIRHVAFALDPLESLLKEVTEKQGFAHFLNPQLPPCSGASEPLLPQQSQPRSNTASSSSSFGEMQPRANALVNLTTTTTTISSSSFQYSSPSTLTLVPPAVVAPPSLPSVNALAGLEASKLTRVVFLCPVCDSCQTRPSQHMRVHKGMSDEDTARAVTLMRTRSLRVLLKEVPSKGRPVNEILAEGELQRLRSHYGHLGSGYLNLDLNQMASVDAEGFTVPSRFAGLLAQSRQISSHPGYSSQFPELKNILGDFQTALEVKVGEKRKEQAAKTAQMFEAIVILTLWSTPEDERVDFTHAGDLVIKMGALTDTLLMTMKGRVRPSTLTKYLDACIAFVEVTCEKCLGDSSTSAQYSQLNYKSYRMLIGGRKRQICGSVEFSLGFRDIEARKLEHLLPVSIASAFFTSEMYVSNMERAEAMTLEEAGSITEKDALNLRDLLIVSGIINTVRRSLELSTFALGDITRGSHTSNVTHMSYFDVREHKRWQSFKAYIAFNALETAALMKFIEFYRPLICPHAGDKDPVFPSMGKGGLPLPATEVSKNLSLSRIGALSDGIIRAALQVGSLPGGGRFTSRSWRTSVVTHLKKTDLTEEDKKKVAVIMAHRRETAKLFYDVGGRAGAPAAEVTDTVEGLMQPMFRRRLEELSTEELDSITELNNRLSLAQALEAEGECEREDEEEEDQLAMPPPPPPPPATSASKDLSQCQTASVDSLPPSSESLAAAVVAPAHPPSREEVAVKTSRPSSSYAPPLDDPEETLADTVFTTDLTADDTQDVAGDMESVTEVAESSSSAASADKTKDVAGDMESVTEVAESLPSAASADKTQDVAGDMESVTEVAESSSSAASADKTQDVAGDIESVTEVAESSSSATSAVTVDDDLASVSSGSSSTTFSGKKRINTEKIKKILKKKHLNSNNITKENIPKEIRQITGMKKYTLLRFLKKILSK